MLTAGDEFGDESEMITLLTDALSGHSRVTVLQGEAGVGKTALLGYLSDRVDEWFVATAAGVG